MRTLFILPSIAFAIGLVFVAPDPVLAQACTHLAGKVICPPGVTPGSSSLSFKTADTTGVGGINWNDGSMSFVLCCPKFLNEFGDASSRFNLTNLTSPGPDGNSGGLFGGLTSGPQIGFALPANGTASPSQVASVIEGDDALLEEMTSPPGPPPTTSVLDFLGPAATDPTAFDFSPTNFLQTPRHRSRPVFRRPPPTSEFLTPTVPFEPFSAGTQRRQNPGTPLISATPPPAGSTAANDDEPGSSGASSSTELYLSLPFPSQGQSADSYQNKLRLPLVVGFEAEATSWLTLHGSQRLTEFPPDDKLRTSAERSGTDADRASEILWLRELARAEQTTADSSLTADPEPVGNVDLTFEKTPPTGTFATTDQPSDDGQTPGNSTTTPPVTNPLVPISTRQVEKRTDSGGVVVTRTTEVTQNPNGSVTTTNSISNSREGETSRWSTTVTPGINPDGSTTETRTRSNSYLSATETTRTNSDGSTTTEVVNSEGGRVRITTTTDLGDGVTRIVTTNSGDVTRTDTIQPDGSIDRFAVDKNGRTLWSSTARSNADGSTTETTQSRNGVYTRTTWPNGASSETRRINNGIVVQVTVTRNPDGSTTRTVSPNNGDTWSSTTKTETVSVFEDGSSVTMDSAGNPILETRPGTISVVAQDDGTVIIGDTAAVTDGVLRFLDEAIVIN